MPRGRKKATPSQQSQPSTLQDSTGRTLAEVHSSEVQELKGKILSELQSADQATARARALLAELV